MPKYKNIKEIIDNKKGYLVEKINNEDEFNNIKNLIVEIYQKEIQQYTKNQKIINYIENYHLIKLDEKIHKKIWTREKRRAPKKLLKILMKTDFYSRIKKEFGKLKFSDMVEKGKPDVFWRLVRPRKKNDVGPMHADSWFWKVNQKKVEKGYKILKFWMMLSENCECGLGVMPFSQLKKDWNYEVVYKDGLYKPNFIVSKNIFKYNPLSLKTKNGHYVLFNYDLLHFGQINTSDVTRCSLEITFLYKTLNI